MCLLVIQVQPYRKTDYKPLIYMYTRKTWLESVEADMAKLEIDKDVHDRNKWRRNVNVMKRKSNPIGKRTINR